MESAFLRIQYIGTAADDFASAFAVIDPWTMCAAISDQTYGSSGAFGFAVAETGWITQSDFSAPVVQTI